MFKNIEKCVTSRGLFRVVLGGPQNGCGHAGIAEDGQQGVPVHHGVVVRVPVVDVLIHDRTQDLIRVDPKRILDKFADYSLLVSCAHSICYCKVKAKCVILFFISAKF